MTFIESSTKAGSGCLSLRALRKHDGKKARTSTCSNVVVRQFLADYHPSKEVLAMNISDGREERSEGGGE